MSLAASPDITAGPNALVNADTAMSNTESRPAGDVDPQSPNLIEHGNNVNGKVLESTTAGDSALPNAKADQPPESANVSGASPPAVPAADESEDVRNVSRVRTIMNGIPGFRPKGRPHRRVDTHRHHHSSHSGGCTIF